MMKQEDRPKVSVCVVTYNQIKYIRQCLQSIVDQETDFVFEVIVEDDFSTDGTRVIVAEFAERYPRIIKPVFLKKNVGPFINYKLAHEKATGLYVAHIDGDDYMLPGKLKRQVEILDNNPEIAIACHLMKGEGDIPIASENNLHHPRIGNTNTLIEIGCYFCHSSKMNRASASSN